ncbi:putative phosphatidylinositol-3,4,5-trisphosphate 3-phosphatase [Lachancea thermotolerans CBS 6340]|uniref:phosphatidylinositol-3,4,5-trisphosphate 3-phosphatase n=1 Tax=Lachancea thermotolerans (strain ATCC 56472 / CBS 6340 / NRRL Y-8284) TaxID=559295 RepID=C5DCS4_LACTC|nr:KLTH0B05412p [Lachancea thermotolerans CBS 6340]CAR21585.1 KLTH0B05412p [Lachancea thermotolerans CBS 6340]
MPFSLQAFTPENILRSVYSSPIKVHKNDLGFSLDLSYITRELIVCSYPVIKYPQLLYRNSLKDLISYLNLHHGAGNWKIYNFKAEKGASDYSDEDLVTALFELSNFCEKASASAGPLLSTIYDPTKSPCKEGHDSASTQSLSSTRESLLERVGHYIQRYGWLDHSPPPFTLLQEILDDMHEYLIQDSSRVVLLHCKLGKGRSGSVVVAYLMKYMRCSLREGREIFVNNRFKVGLTQGVTISSQLRYLGYHERFLQADHPSNWSKILSELTRAQFMINSFEIIHLLSAAPVKLESKTYTMSIKIQIYNRNRDGLIDVFDTNNKEQSIDSKPHSNLNRVSVGQRITESDIRISFGLRHKGSAFIDNVTQLTSISHFWINLYWETLACSRSESTDHYTLDKLANEQSRCRDRKNFAMFSIKWAELDGMKGLQSKGFKLFETFTLRWQLL